MAWFSHRPSTGLALSGGSTWGIAHVGVLKALTEANISINYIAGTSAGSLVAACYAFGMSIDDMIDATGSINWKKLSKFGYSRLGLRSNAPMEAFITDLLGDAKIEDAKIPLAIVAADIETHEKVVLKEGSLPQAIRASTAIPGLFKPVPLNGRLLVDGAVAENLPVPTVRDLGAEFVIAVNLLGRHPRRPRHLFNVLIESFSALTHHHDQRLAQSADIRIEPDLSSFDAGSFKDADAMLQAGYDAAMKVIPRIQERIGRKARERRGLFSKWLTKLYPRNKRLT